MTDPTPQQWSEAMEPFVNLINSRFDSMEKLLSNHVQDFKDHIADDEVFHSDTKLALNTMQTRDATVDKQNDKSWVKWTVFGGLGMSFVANIIAVYIALHPVVVQAATH